VSALTNIDHARTCVAFYQTPNPSSPTLNTDALFKKVQSLGEKLKNSSDWLAFPKSEPYTQLLVEEFIKLPPVAREELQARVVKVYSKSSSYRKVVLLALYERSTWNEFLDRAMKGPLLDDSMVNSLIPVIRAMPEELKVDVLAKVTAKYSKLSKVNFTRFPLRLNLRLAPKRSIDALILHIIQPDEWFRHDVEITQNPLKSYENYLKFLRTDIFKNSDRGNYTTSEIMTVAEAIQKVLQQKASTLQGPSVTITGSFPNGRAKIADTDLDSRLSHRELHAYLDDMSASINQAMKVYPVPSKFTVEAMWATTTAHFAAQINPLFLRITPTEIQVEVYSAVQPLHKDSVLMEYNYEGPKRYTLKSIELDVPKLNPVEKSKSPGDFSWLVSQIESHLSDFSLLVKPAKKQSDSATSKELVKSVQALNDSQRLDILHKLTSHSGSIAANKEAIKLILLALNYKPAWEKFIKDAIKNPQFNDSLFNALVPVFKNLPSDIKYLLQQEISKAYPEINTKAWVRKGIFFKKILAVLSPRDALDVISNQIFVAKEEVLKEIAKGASVEDAYNKFLSGQRLRLYSGTNVGNYKAAQVLHVSNQIKKTMADRPKIFGEAPIYLVGQFPNGRADNTSFSIEVITADPLNRAIEKEISFAINGNTKPQAREFIEVEVRSKETTLIKEAIINPVQIKITKDSVSLQIHDPVQNIDRDQFQLPKNYPEPTVLKLPSTKELVNLTLEKNAS
tara:strand:+ start:7212 stop:9416 length:2205 start_codon:yes stop_codon:yes gene_type:complete